MTHIPELERDAILAELNEEIVGAWLTAKAAEYGIPDLRLQIDGGHVVGKQCAAFGDSSLGIGDTLDGAVKMLRQTWKSPAQRIAELREQIAQLEKQEASP